MLQSILQGAATLSMAILLTDAVKETATAGQHAFRKWLAVLVVLVIIVLLVDWMKLPPAPQKNIAVT